MKTAMIWGAGGGIGGALTSALAAGEWKLTAVARGPQVGVHPTAHLLEADFSNAWEVEQAVQGAAMEVEKVDLWIYCAGDITAEKVQEMEPETWARILDANLSGAYLALHHSMPLLAEDAVLVLIGAVSERLRLPGLSAYAAAKAGLEAFADALAKEERKKRVILVRPGVVETRFWEKVPFQQPKDAAPPEKVAARILGAVRDGHAGRLDLVS